MMKVCLLSAMLLSACGDTNFNEILLTSKAQQDSIDQLLIEARYEYDKGNTDKAMVLADKAAAINPLGEGTLILKANIFLSQAGLDAFGIAEALMTDTSKKEGDKTASALDSLSGVIGLTETDFEGMGEVKTLEGTSTKIVLPYSAPKAREGSSASVRAINDAIATLCPLIDEAAKIALDSRHSCEKAPNVQKSGKSHFAWALAHLGEGVAFNSVVLYDNDNGVPNIQDLISGVDKNNLTLLIERISLVTSAVNTIFPTGSGAESSMLNALYSDLETTSKAFTVMAGLPESVTKKITDATTNLRTKISTVTSQGSGATADISKQNEALRNSLTTGMATQLKTKIETANNLSDADRIKACCAYKAINSQAVTPSNCASVTVAECSAN